MMSRKCTYIYPKNLTFIQITKYQYYRLYQSVSLVLLKPSVYVPIQIAPRTIGLSSVFSKPTQCTPSQIVDLPKYLKSYFSYFAGFIFTTRIKPWWICIVNKLKFTAMQLEQIVISFAM